MDLDTFLQCDSSQIKLDDFLKEEKAEKIITTFDNKGNNKYASKDIFVNEIYSSWLQQLETDMEEAVKNNDQIKINSIKESRDDMMREIDDMVKFFSELSLYQLEDFEFCRGILFTLGRRINFLKNSVNFPELKFDLEFVISSNTFSSATFLELDKCVQYDIVRIVGLIPNSKIARSLKWFFNYRILPPLKEKYIKEKEELKCKERNSTNVTVEEEFKMHKPGEWVEVYVGSSNYHGICEIKKINLYSSTGINKISISTSKKYAEDNLTLDHKSVGKDAVIGFYDSVAKAYSRYSSLKDPKVDFAPIADGYLQNAVATGINTLNQVAAQTNP